MAVQVDYRIAPSDQFSVYNPDTKSNKTITYFTLLAKIRGDLNLNGGGSGGGDITGGGSANYVAKFSSDKNIVNSQIYDTGTYIGIGNLTPAHKLDVDGGVFADYFQLDTSYSDGAIAGKFSWNPDRETAELGLDGTVSLILGQDNLWYVKNQTGSAIPKGRAVMAVGALGASSRILVAPMVADGTISPKYLIGVTIEEIANGDDGFAVSQGKLRGFNTSGYTAGTVLYCDPNNAGQFTSTEPTAPDLKLPIAFTIDSKNNGTLAIRVTAGTTIGEANDVELTSVADNDFLVYNSTSGVWENEAIGIFKTIAVSGQDPVVADAYNDTLTFVAGSNITITTDAATDTITINSTDQFVGTVTSVDLTASTGISVSGGPITTSGSITVTNTAPDQTVVLTGAGTTSISGAYPSFTITSNDQFVGTVTSVDLTAGTGITVSGGPVTTSGSITVTNNDRGSSQNIFKNFAVAGQSTIVADTNDDTLTVVAGSGVTITTNDSTDTLTISATGSGGSVTSVGTSAPLTGGTITTSGTISITQSGASTDGYLSSTDWNTFNGKEPALTKGNLTEATSAILAITGGTNAVIGSGTSIQVSQATTTTSGYLSSTDWNTFNDKEPALTKGNLTETTSGVLTIGSGTGAVIGSGTTITVSQSGISTSGYLSSTDWNTFNDKEPALTKGNLTETTSSIFTISGGTNAVIGSGTTIAVSQADASTSGYLSSTDWNTFNDKEPALTKGNLTETTSSILSITGGTNSIIGSGVTIAVSQATTSTSGYLSSTDWNTFNDKEPALTKGNLTEATSSVLTITGGTGAVIGSGTTIQVSQAGASASGFLSSTDWNTFNNKQGTITLTTTGSTGAATFISNTLNIPNYADQFVGTVTSVAALTLGTTGTDLSSTVVNSTTTPVITLNVPTASATNRGALSSTDWTTFNSKEPALTKGNLTEATSAVLTITGGAGAVIGTGTSIQVAQSGASTSGFLSSTDWNTFNGKADYSFVTIAVSGQTDVVADSASDTLTLVAGAGVTITTDAVGDSVTIAATGSGGTVTSIATSAPLSGGTITSTGTISITQSDASTDGYLSSTDWNTFNDKEPALTKGNLTETTSSILTITGGTGAVVGSGTTIAVTQASTSTSGFLSSADWNTFNDKEPTVTKGNLTEATSSVLTITDGTGAVIGSGTSIQVSQSSSSTSGFLSSTDWNTFNGKASNSFTTIAVATQTSIVADSATDTLTIVAGTGVTITTNDSTDTLTISATGSGGTVTSVDLTAGTGISVSGGPITTSGSITVTNTAPDQTVVLTAGTGISTSGTYPNFTVTNSAPDQTVVLTASTGITTSGTYPNFTIANSAPDQTVVLTGGTGITTSGTYPNFTVTNSAPDQTVVLTAGTGITTSGTYPNFTVTNSAPDQTVAITAGTGISVSGTYPNFTVTNSSPSSGGTVTSVAALTLGTTGTDLSSTVVNGTTTPVITLNVPTASAANRGALSSTDWTTFNSKQGAITLTTTGSTGAATFVSNTLNIPNYTDQFVGTVTSVNLTAGTRIEVAGGPITTSGSITVTHGVAAGADFTTAQTFEARVLADGGIFEALGEVAIAIGSLEDAASPSSTDFNDGVVIQNVAIDEFGHLLGVGATDLDDRYYTETEIDALFALETLDTVTDRGATTTNSITIGGLVVDTDTLVVDSANNRVVIGGTSASYPLHVKTQVSNVSIYADYDIAAYSDARVKEDVITISGALEKVRSMRGVTYKRIGLESDKRFMGVIAQEVLPYAPEVVHQDEDGMYSVSYQNMVGLLIEAMKEQQQQIDELKEQLNKYLK